MLSGRLTLLLHGVIGVILTWAYWPMLVDFVHRWREDPQYSHGFLVPVFSAYLLWRNRRDLREGLHSPQWWGLGLFALGSAIRFLGHLYYISWLEGISLIVSLAGWAAVAGGRKTLRASLLAILFLGFTLPLPFRVQIALGGSLQRLATLSSSYLLQTIGVPAIPEGNIIVLSEQRIGIAEACNGLSMLLTFFALAAGFAILIRRPWWDKLLLVMSAVPIAVIANVIRITVTGALYDASQDKLAQIVFHDVAGWLMMPFALGLLFAEAWFLRRMIIAKP